MVRTEQQMLRDITELNDALHALQDARGVRERLSRARRLMGELSRAVLNLMVEEAEMRRGRKPPPPPPRPGGNVVSLRARSKRGSAT